MTFNNAYSKYAEPEGMCVLNIIDKRRWGFLWKNELL